MSPQVSDDLLRGIDEIASFIRETPSGVSRLIQQGRIPAGRLGRTYIASKQRLVEHYRELTAGVAVVGPPRDATAAPEAPRE